MRLENAIKKNKEFFDLAKDKEYLRVNLIKTMPNIIDRVKLLNYYKY